MSIWILVSKQILNLTKVFLSHNVGIARRKKDMFYNFVLNSIIIVRSEELLIVASNRNGPVAKDPDGFKKHHKGKG